MPETEILVLTASHKVKFQKFGLQPAWVFTEAMSASAPPSYGSFHSCSACWLLPPPFGLSTRERGRRGTGASVTRVGGRAFRDFLEVPSVISAYFLCMLGFMYGVRDLTEAALGVWN